MRDTSENLPAGGHLSTARDLVLFALTLNSGGFSSTNSRSKNTFDNTVGIEPSWRNAIPSAEFYGSGEMFFPDQSRLWVGHTGRIAGGSAIVVLQPESDVAIAVLTNAKGWNGYISLIDQLKLILEESSDLLK
ncbi:MAG: serine beta-lactamase-like protein LACTB [Arenicella sp.]|jgi:serine beta-lactamase-like protein LACTB